MNKISKYLTPLTLGCCLVISHFSYANYSLPNYQTVELDNQLTIYLMEQHEVPLIDINIVVKTGAVNDTDKPGLNALTLANMALGTSQQTKSQIEESLDFIGAKLDTNAGVEFSSLSASIASKDQAKVLGIMRDMLLSPRFDPLEFSKHQTRHLIRLEQQKESPRAVINSYFNRLMFGNTGYGSPINGDRRSIKNISLAELKAHHHHWYQPQNTAVILVGNFDSEAMLIRLKALFSPWKNRAKITKRIPKPSQQHSQSNVLLVNKGDAIETRFVIGGPGITRSNPDYVAVQVINTILGGRFTSWLNDELRVNAGLTYGARSGFNAFGHAGTFSMASFTKTSSTVEAIDLALNTYQRLWKQGIDASTLASAKAYVKGQFPPKYETSQQLSQLLGAMFGYGFDQQFINTFEQQVNSLTPEKAADIVTKYFPQQNLQLVLIGKADDIRHQVSKYGLVTEIDIDSLGFDFQLTSAIP